MRMNPASKWSFIQANNPETLAKLVRYLIHCTISHAFRALLSPDSLAESWKRAIFLVLWQKDPQGDFGLCASELGFTPHHHPLLAPSALFLALFYFRRPSFFLNQTTPRNGTTSILEECATPNFAIWLAQFLYIESNG